MKTLFLYIIFPLVALTTIVQAQQKEYDPAVLIIEKDLSSSLLGHEPTGLKTAQFLNNNQGHILARKQQQKEENNKDHDTYTSDNNITIINDNNVTTVANKNMTTHLHNKYGKFMFASPALLTTNPAFVIIGTVLTVFIWFSGFVIDHFIDRQEQFAYYSAISRLGQDGYCYDTNVDDDDDEQFLLQELDLNLMDSNADIIL